MVGLCRVACSRGGQNLEMMAMVLWRIRRNMCEVVFEGKQRKAEVAGCKMCSFCGRGKKAVLEFTTTPVVVVSVLTVWQGPREGFLKINVDVSWRLEEIGYVAVARAWRVGEFVWAIAKPLQGSGRAEYVEAQALLMGMELDVRLGTMPFMVESDNVVIMWQFNENGRDSYPVGIFLDDFYKSIEVMECLGVHKINRK